MKKSSPLARNTISRKPVAKKPFSGLVLVKRHPVLSVVVGLLFAAVLFFAMSDAVFQYRAHQEKEQFLQAQAELDGIYKNIVAKVGEPAEHKSSQDCKYTSEEWAKGFLNCYVNERFIYNSLAQSDANSISTRIVQIIKTNNKVTELNPSAYANYFLKSYTFRLSRDFECQIDIDKKETERPPSTTTISSHLYCGKSALKEHFKVTQQ